MCPPKNGLGESNTHLCPPKNGLGGVPPPGTPKNGLGRVKHPKEPPKIPSKSELGQSGPHKFKLGGADPPKPPSYLEWGGSEPP